MWSIMPFGALMETRGSAYELNSLAFSGAEEHRGMIRSELSKEPIFLQSEKRGTYGRRCQLFDLLAFMIG